MAHVHTASFLVDRPTPRTAGLFRRQCVSDLRQVPAAGSTWAARSAASCVVRRRCGRRSGPAPPSPGSPPTGGAVSAATRSATVPSSSAARDDDVGQPDRLGLGRADRAAGQADLQRPRVADQLDEVARAGQVGHEAERRLGQPQLGVVGEHPQVAGERELRAGADGVPLHGGDRDDPRRAQPPEAGLVAADALLASSRRAAGPARRARRATPGSGLNRLRSRPAENARPSPAHHDHPDVVVERRARPRPAPPRWPASAR